MFTKTTECFVTKQQLINFLAAIEMAHVSVPKGKKMEIICFPNGEFAQIFRTQHKSDQNKTLYAIEMYK